MIQVYVKHIGQQDNQSLCDFSTDGKYVASVSPGERLWFGIGSLRLFRLFVALDAMIRNLRTRRGVHLFAGSSEVTLWDAESGLVDGRCLAGHSKPIVALSFSSDGRFLVTSAQVGLFH